MATKKKTATPKKTVAKKTTTQPARKTVATKTKKVGKNASVAPKATAKKVAATKPHQNLKSVPSDKDIANAAGEPWVSVLSVELDPENIGNGAFELDWNDKFVANLVRAGYQQKANEADSVIVDRWFQEVCKNIAQENFEQWEANQPYESRPRVMDRRDLGDGRTEIS